MMDLVAGWFRADERRFRHVDVALLLITAVIVAVGLILLYSVTNHTLREDGFDPFARVKKQAIVALIGVVLIVVIASVDYRLFKVYAGFIYGGIVVALMLVLVPGIGATDAQGVAQRYFGASSAGGFQVTPSEFAKVAVVVMLAAVMSEIRTAAPSLRDVLRVLTIAAVPVVLVFIQPNLGTSIVLGTIVFSMLLVAGTRARHLVASVVTGLLLVFAAFQMNLIKPYQVDRITAFLDPTAVSYDVRYNSEQSLIAIGSGGLTGVGYLQGAQTNLDYVPQQHTDFIFTVAGEEFGFVGAMGILLLYALLLYRAIRIAQLAKDVFGTYLAAGVAATFAMQMFVNIGMVIGIMPITGIPLPFMSYGGSSMLASLMGIGILENVHMRRFR